MRVSLALGSLIVVAGCGRSEPARSVEPEPGRSGTHAAPSSVGRAASSEPAARSSEPQIQVEGEVGGLDPDAVDAVVQSAGREIDRCWERGVARNELVAGSVQLVLGIGASGRSVYGYVEQSTLGEAEMERCMLKALSTRAFPKPVGGKVGLVRTSFSFELGKGTRAPVRWSSSRVDEALGGAATEIAACKHGADGKLTATVYIEQIERPPPAIDESDAGDAGQDAGEDAADAGPIWVGAAISVGVAAPDQRAWAAVECLERVLSRAVYPAPGSYPAKVTFEL